MRQAWRYLRRIPSLCVFALFFLLWWPVRDWNGPPESIKLRIRWLLTGYAALLIGLLVLADRLDRLLVPEAYRTLRGAEEEVPYP